MPRPPLPPGKTLYPLYRRLDGPQSRSRRADNLVPSGIRSRTVQSVVSRYTDWATRPTVIYFSFELSVSCVTTSTPLCYSPRIQKLSECPFWCHPEQDAEPGQLHWPHILTGFCKIRLQRYFTKFSNLFKANGGWAFCVCCWVTAKTK